MTNEDFSRFVSFDDNLSAFEDTEDLQQNNGTIETSTEAEDARGGEELAEDDSPDSMETPNHQQVVAACDIIRRFLEGQSNVDFSNFYNLEHQVTSSLCNGKIQAKITDYFVRKN